MQKSANIDVFKLINNLFIVNIMDKKTIKNKNIVLFIYLNFVFWKFILYCINKQKFVFV
jgi:hypothetical protein